MNKQEAKVSVFFLTSLASGLLVGTLTRFISTSHFTRAMGSGLGLGLLFLVLSICLIGLDD